MKYFIDTTDVDQIKKWYEILGNSFAGVTTNSSMLDTQDKIKRFLDYIKHIPMKEVMVQIDPSMDVSIFPPMANLIFKSSMIQSNFKMMNEGSGSRAATTCYDIIQINQAIEFGCKYSMVYYAKNKYKGLLEDAVKLKKSSGSDIKLVAASIHTVEEVTHAINSGIEYVTVRPDVLELLFNNEQAMEDLYGK